MPIGQTAGGMNIKFKCSLGDLAEFDLMLGQRLPVIIKTAHMRVAQETVDLLVEATKNARGQPGSPPGAVAQRRLLHGYVVMGQAGSITISNVAMQDMTRRRYLWNVEWGRPAGKRPPLALIQDWVRWRLHITDRRQNRDVAWAVAKKIGQRGLKPRRFLMDQQKRISNLHERAIMAALDGELERITAALQKDRFGFNF